MHAGDALVRETARAVVARVAPDELGLFDAGAAAYLAAPASLDTLARRRDEPLGFGVAGAVAYLTPLVVALVKEVIEQVTRATGDELGAGGASVARRVMRWLLRLVHVAPRPASPGVHRLTPDQLALVRDRAYGRAQDAGLTPAQAGLVADALVGQLAMAA